jgi:hypothetical protein
MFDVNCSTKDREPIRVENKIVGYLDGDKFIKPVLGSRHKLKTPRGWAIDAEAWDQQIRARANEFVILDKEGNTEYHCSVQDFERYKGRMNRGHGEQYFLTDPHWRPINPDCFQLLLFGEGNQ